MRQSRRASPRPSWYHRAILLFLLVVLSSLLAITEFFRNNFGALTPFEGNSSIVWGTVDVLFALVLLYAGYALVQGGRSTTLALLVAVILAFRWANYIVMYQWVTISLIVV